MCSHLCGAFRGCIDWRLHFLAILLTKINTKITCSNMKNGLCPMSVLLLV